MHVLRRTRHQRTCRRSAARPINPGNRESSRIPWEGSPMPSNRVPKYRPHSSGQARVTLNGKDHLLGPYGSAESREMYRRLVAEWLARGGRNAPPEPVEDEPFCVNE